MSFKSFDLDTGLLAGTDRAGYEVATPVQEKVIPRAMSGRDLIVTAQTGTGKTAAFVLPILHKLLNKECRSIRALIVTPTRELAAQVHRDINELKFRTNLRSTTVYGGVSPNMQVKALRRGVDILVACPGRLLDLMNRGHVTLKGLDIMVLDEADRMLDMGFMPDIKRIVSKVPAHRQTMLFSATFPREIEMLAKKILNNPVRISIGVSCPANTVSHSLFPVAQHLKSKLLLRILDNTDTNSVLVFTRTKRRAVRLADQIERRKYKVTSLHGDRSQAQRDAAIKGFRNGRYNIMVATDIAARGLDIEHISHVINFDIPDTTDDYIHRIGRTGRARKSGAAFTFTTSGDGKIVRKLESIIGEKIQRKTVKDFDYSIPKPRNSYSSPYNKRRISA